MEMKIDWTNLNCNSCGKRADHARLEDLEVGQKALVLEAYCQGCMSYGVWVHKQRTAEEIEIKYNTVGCRETCVTCKASFRPGMGCLWPFLRGTRRPVCADCAEKAGLKYPFVDTDPKSSDVKSLGSSWWRGRGVADDDQDE